jgi:hypothetical protein
MSIRSLAAALLALSACAGPGGYRVAADVRSMAPGARDSAGITNTAGAKVDLVCADASKNRELGRTDEQGSLRAEGEGTVPLACKLQVSAAGLKPVQYPVADVCQEQNGDGCREVALKTVLAPSARGSAGDGK